LLDAIERLFDALSAALLAEHDVRTLLQLVHQAMRRDFLDLVGRSGAIGAAHVQGIGRFQRAFVRCVDASLDRSMAFALALQESWQHGSLTDLRVVGDVDAQLKAWAAEHPEEKKVNEFAFNWILESACSGDPQISGWLEQLIAAAPSSEAVGDTLWSVLELLTFMTNTPMLETLEKNRSNPDPLPSNDAIEQIYREHPNLRRLMDFMRRPRLVLSGRFQELFGQWASGRQTQWEQAITRGEHVLTRFKEQRSTFDRVLGERREAIAEHPRYWLRPGGFDHVDIEAAPLRNVGIRSIAFYPEGYAFPDTVARIYIRRETPHLLTFSTALVDLRLALHDEVVRSKAHFENRDVVAELLEFVVVDVLARIVTGSRTLRHPRHGRAAISAADEHREVIDLELKQRTIRPHPRRLPEGHRASENAMVLHRELYRTDLRSGYTFVRAHYQHGRLVYDLPTGPTMAYTDDDLFDLGGES
ncbi:hypothetical protein HY634_04085, partial [Candidatus Uhrbacteria bacterium]|nr:hypothetical protein [Candidatus Uhrbacteria bacterium]